MRSREVEPIDAPSLLVKLESIQERKREITGWWNEPRACRRFPRGSRLSHASRHVAPRVLTLVAADLTGEGLLVIEHWCKDACPSPAGNPLNVRGHAARAGLDLSLYETCNRAMAEA